MATQVANVRKAFKFRADVDGIEDALFQEITHPKPNLEKSAHGDSNHDVNTAGRISYDDAELTKLVPSDGPDSRWWKWLKEVQNDRTGSGAQPDDYFRKYTISELAPDNTPLDTWVWYNVWPVSLDRTGLSRTTSDNMIETATLNVDEVEQL